MKIKAICKFQDDDFSEYEDFGYEAEEWCESMAEECGFDEYDDMDSLIEWLRG